MVGVSASVNLPLHHKVLKFSFGTGSPGWSQKKGRKTVVVIKIIMPHLQTQTSRTWGTIRIGSRIQYRTAICLPEDESR